ncbi:MAG: ATP-dependent zinc metalloprotease FtsH [Gammaproteobacteria bacterium]|jgi:cell division protease FtsH|nr:ATP-dependent zinc metalloprotease FtsH [Gammaproteobacteria bacterium]
MSAPKLPGSRQPLSRLTPGGEGPPWRNYAIAAAAILALAALLNLFLAPSPPALSYTEFKQAVRDGRVAQVTFEGERIRGRFFAGAGPDAEAAASEAQSGDGDGKTTSDTAASGQQAESANGGDGATAEADGQAQAGAAGSGSADAGADELGPPFTSTKPQVNDPQLLDLLERNEVEIAAEPTETGLLGRILVSFLPWVLILGLFLYISYRMQQRMMGGAGGQQGGIFGFGKSKAKRIRAEDSDVGLDDVAGLDNAKADLAEIIDHLADPKRFRALGAKMPKGVMLVGPPGTGKTLLARAVAGEAGVPFFSISGSEFVEMFVGVGASRVRDLFESAKKAAPCVIFIDEIDAVGRTRGAGMGGGHDEREQTLNQILAEMDGFTPQHDIVVLAATNRPDVLDNALLRPGRFDRKVYLELPGREARHAILEVHAAKVKLADDVDLERLAARTVGFSGADLENLVNEAALLAGRRRQEAVDMQLFADARDKLVLGAEREQGIGDDERELVAVHESGHALMAWLLPEADPLDKVTIIPRGRALGATEQTPEEERRTYKSSYLRDRIGVMLGGRVAEQVMFDDVTTGAEADLDNATKLARRMVSRWGMSERIGPIAFKRGEEHVFLGREMAESPEFSDDTAKRIDDEITALIRAVEEHALELMREHEPRLKRLSERLLEAETLSREDIDALLRESTDAEPLRAANA